MQTLSATVKVILPYTNNAVSFGWTPGVMIHSDLCPILLFKSKINAFLLKITSK